MSLVIFVAPIVLGVITLIAAIRTIIETRQRYFSEYVRRKRKQ